MSMRKIAEMTGLSITTVSHTLNGTRAVSQKSRDLIEQAAKEIGYKPVFFSVVGFNDYSIDEILLRFLIQFCPFATRNV